MNNARTIGALLLCQCVLVAGLTLSIPFFALYLTKQRGLPADQVGLAVALMMLSTAFSHTLAGELSDLFGGKPVMEFAILSRAVFSALLAWAMLHDWSIGSLIALNVGSSFCGNFYEPAARAWLTQACEASERLKWFAWQRVSVNLGWAIGPALGGFLAEQSYAMLFGASSVVAFLCLAWMRFGVKHLGALRGGETFRPARALTAAADSRFLKFSLLCLLISVVHAQLVVGLSVHASAIGVSERQIGLLFALNGAMVVLLQNLVSRAMAGGSLALWVAGGCLFYAAGYTLVGQAASLTLLLASVALVTLGEITVSPGQYTLAANLAPEKLKGRYIGFHGLAHQLGGALGPLLAGVGLQNLGARMWLYVGVAGAAAGIGFFGMRRQLES